MQDLLFGRQAASARNYGGTHQWGLPGGPRESGTVSATAGSDSTGHSELLTTVHCLERGCQQLKLGWLLFQAQGSFMTDFLL